MATQGPDNHKVTYLKQTLIMHLKEIAEGDVDKLSFDVLHACVELLKNELAKVAAAAEPAVIVKAPLIPPPPPPPMPLITLSAPIAMPVTTAATSTTAAPAPEMSHHETLTETLKKIKAAIPDDLNTQQTFTPLMQSRLTGIEAMEEKRIAFLQRRAAERADPSVFENFTQPLLAEVVNLRRTLKVVAPKPMLSDVEAALLREKNMAAYNERMEQKNKMQLAKEIDAMLQSFILVDLNADDATEQDKKTSMRLST